MGLCPTISAPPRFGVEQGFEGHHDAHLDVHIRRGGLPGDPFDQGVGHDLIPRTRIPGGEHRVGVPLQGGQARDALLDRKEPRQHAHRVRRRLQPDPPIGPGCATAGHIRGLVGVVGALLDQALGPPQRQLVEPAPGELLVHQPPTLGAQV
jgi:hypothetical protein